MEIGQKFTVDYRLEKVYEDREIDGRKQIYRFWEKVPLKEPTKVYLIGQRWRQEGIYHKDSPGLYGDPSDWGPPYLETTKSLKCALVTPAMNRKEFLVLWNDLDAT